MYMFRVRATKGKNTKRGEGEENTHRTNINEDDINL